MRCSFIQTTAQRRDESCRQPSRIERIECSFRFNDPFTIETRSLLTLARSYPPQLYLAERIAHPRVFAPAFNELHGDIPLYTNRRSTGEVKVACASRTDELIDFVRAVLPAAADDRRPWRKHCQHPNLILVDDVVNTVEFRSGARRARRTSAKRNAME